MESISGQDQLGISSHQDSGDENTKKKDMRDKLVDIFIRDWRSPHCKFIK